MGSPDLSLEQTVEEVLRRWPNLAQVFIRHRMACVGCAMASFDTLAEVAQVYGLRASAFLQELGEALGEEEG